MRKTVCLILSFILILNAFAITGFANEISDDSFSIDDYTLNDLRNMTTDERLDLLNNYEKTYISETSQSNQSDALYQPYWNSGNAYGDNSHEWKTHELITLEAILELENYLNNYENGADKLFASGEDVLIFSLALAVASALPDRIGNGGAETLFVGHFYNPETEKNFLGLKSPTAKTNAVAEYDKAISLLNSNINLSQNSSDSIEALGCVLHYIQDASEPHHSSNVIANPINNSHNLFESYAYDNIDSFISCSINHNTTVMKSYSSLSIGDLVHFAAVISHSYIDSVNNQYDKSQWYNVADICIDNATSFTTIVLYKIFKEKGFI